MTNPQIDAGRELDAVVAEEVMGQRECDGWRPTSSGGVAKYCDHESGECRPPFPGPQVMGVLPHYSTDIAAAWTILTEIDWWWWEINGAGDVGQVSCWISPDGNPVNAKAETAPLAICRCALKAVRADTEGADAD